MSERDWMEWDGFEDLPEGNVSDNEGLLSPEALEQILEYIDGNISGSKDMVFKMPSPIDLGPQDSTDTPYPHTGTTQFVTLSISSDSIMRSNILVSIEKMRGSSGWSPIGENIMLSLGHSIATSKIEDDLEKNDRLRINVVEGDLEDIKDMTVILNIE